MNAITIPKHIKIHSRIKIHARVKIHSRITKGEKLVIIPHTEYEEFSRWRKSSQLKSKKGGALPDSVNVFIPSPTLKKDLARAREDYKQGKYITLDELKQKLAIKD